MPVKDISLSGAFKEIERSKGLEAGESIYRFTDDKTTAPVRETENRYKGSQYYSTEDSRYVSTGYEKKEEPYTPSVKRSAELLKDDAKESVDHIAGFLRKKRPGD